jgi:rSAM/selenodomain-associated transferase 2
MISVIIPVYNEEHVLMTNGYYFRGLAQDAELIFVDGGSGDRTVELASEYGRILSAPKNRALQMNKGAKAAHHDILLFLHVDTILSPASLKTIEAMVSNKQLIGGCLRQVFNQPGLIFKWIAWTGNMRARILKIFYGDQGIFVRKDVFWKLGGFPEINLGEDVLLTRRLRGAGNVGVLPCPVYCSARRWVNQGIFKTFLLNMRITWSLLSGKNLDGLAKAYKDVR